MKIKSFSKHLCFIKVLRENIDPNNNATGKTKAVWKKVIAVKSSTFNQVVFYLYYNQCKRVRIAMKTSKL
jgi:hypothetical protein